MSSKQDQMKETAKKMEEEHGKYIPKVNARRMSKLMDKFGNELPIDVARRCSKNTAPIKI
jgi:hypothetical protein